MRTKKPAQHLWWTRGSPQVTNKVTFLSCVWGAAPVERGPPERERETAGSRQCAVCVWLVIVWQRAHLCAFFRHWLIANYRHGACPEKCRLRGTRIHRRWDLAPPIDRHLAVVTFLFLSGCSTFEKLISLCVCALHVIGISRRKEPRGEAAPAKDTFHNRRKVFCSQADLFRDCVKWFYLARFSTNALQSWFDFFTEAFLSCLVDKREILIRKNGSFDQEYSMYTF